ncbi:NF-kappa-B inhibitor-interacting Ras-like protein [Aphelenchoides fujianensis]|nr:NF-kappa-B inhibitor-interacting Ras-like protein [Aphelenchoides fujianensis]
MTSRNDRGLSVKALRIRNAASRRLSVNPTGGSLFGPNLAERRFSRKDIPLDSRAKHEFDSASGSDGEEQQVDRPNVGEQRRPRALQQPNQLLFGGPPSSPRHLGTPTFRRSSAAVLHMKKAMRIVVLGPKKSGKTSLLLQLVLAENPLQRPYSPDHRGQLPAGDQRGRERAPESSFFHDTAGFQRPPAELPRPLLQVADAFMLVFSVNDAEHFDLVTQLKKTIERAFSKDKRDIPIVLIGTMTDLPGRQVDFETAATWAAKEGVKYFELSANDRPALIEVVHHLVGRHFHPIKESKFSLSRKLKPERSNAQILMDL